MIIFTLVCYFVWGGKKVEWPEVKRIDGFSKWLNPTQAYYEESLDKVVEYKVTRTGWIFLATIAVGGPMGKGSDPFSDPFSSFSCDLFP